MKFLKATPRTIEALRKADAINESKPMKTSISASYSAPSFIPKNVSQPTKNLTIDVQYMGPFFPLYEKMLDGRHSLTVGSLSVTGFSPSNAGWAYVGYSFTSVISVPGTKIFLDEAVSLYTIYFAIENNNNGFAPAGDGGSYFKIYAGNAHPMAGVDGIFYEPICHLERVRDEDQGIIYKVALMRWPNDIYIKDFWLN